MDKEVRALWKTRPWIGIGVALLMAYLILRSLATGVIRFESRRYSNEAEYVTWAEQPVGFALTVAMLAVFFAGATAYCVFRFRRRKNFRAEDGDA